MTEEGRAAARLAEIRERRRFLAADEGVVGEAYIAQHKLIAEDVPFLLDFAEAALRAAPGERDYCEEHEVARKWCEAKHRVFARAEGVDEGVRPQLLHEQSHPQHYCQLHRRWECAEPAPVAATEERCAKCGTRFIEATYEPHPLLHVSDDGASLIVLDHTAERVPAPVAPPTHDWRSCEDCDDVFCIDCGAPGANLADVSAVPTASHWHHMGAGNSANIGHPAPVAVVLGGDEVEKARELVLDTIWGGAGAAVGQPEVIAALDAFQRAIEGRSEAMWKHYEALAVERAATKEAE